MATLNCKSILIVGANRGIGLEFVRQITKLPNPPKYLFATYRDEGKSSELLALAKENNSIQAIKFEVTDYESIPKLAKKVEEKVGKDGLTLLINNAGILDMSGLQKVTADAMVNSYHINTVAPLMLFKEFLPLVKMASSANSGEAKFTANRAAICYISTKVSSFDDNTSGGTYAYRCSKVAGNMIMKNLSIELKDDGILCLILHPGWVQTDMGGPRAIHGLQESVTGMINVITEASHTHNGGFYDFKGNIINW